MKNGIKIFLLTFSFVLALILLFFMKKTENPCKWVIVNCCPENAGAKWECVNIKEFVKPNCSEYYVLCPQIVSPKPSKECVFENGRCVVK